MLFRSGATDETYCVGLTQINLNGSVDFLDPSQWKKTNYPILTGLSSQGDDKYHGPGHNSYVVDEDDYLVNVFHARPGNGTAFARDTFLRIVHFGIDGTPILDMEEKSEILPENKMVTMQIVVSKKAVASPIPTSVPVVPTAAPPATTPPAEVISKKDFIVGKLVYKVTSTSSGRETVQVMIL